MKNYETTRITPPAPPKIKSSFGVVVINVFRVFLVIVGGLALLICASPLWTWVHCKSAPEQMTFEEYLKNGSDNDWVVLTGVYIDGSNKIETQMIRNGQSSGAYAGTYYPLRTGPDDKQPVKVFLYPTKYAVTSPQPYLLYGDTNESPPDKGYELEARQVVRGLRQRGINFQSDLEKILRSCSLGTTDQIILIRQSAQPISDSTAWTMIGVVIVVPIVFLLTFIRRRRS